MTMKFTSARIFHNGVDVGPVSDVSVEYSDGSEISDGAVPSFGFDRGPTISTLTMESTLRGKAARSMLRFIHLMRRATTPYAKGRKLKKPRGRRGKMRALDMWLRGAVRRGMDRTCKRQAENLSAIIGRSLFARDQARTINDHASEIMQADRGIE